uniref:Uncharacterized protein n=1 Tax=Bracon brevicornis TaxID=1563983 RepID=A0A6V7IZN1_9HYME
MTHMGVTNHEDSEPKCNVHLICAEQDYKIGSSIGIELVTRGFRLHMLKRNRIKSIDIEEHIQYMEEYTVESLFLYRQLSQMTPKAFFSCQFLPGWTKRTMALI